MRTKPRCVRAGDYPEPVVYRRPVRAGILQDIFFSGTSVAHLVPHGCYLEYATPHALDTSKVQRPVSSVSLSIEGFHGFAAGKRIDFEVDYQLIQEACDDGEVLGYVNTEYRDANRYISAETFLDADKDRLIMLKSGHRPFHPDDLFQLMRLLRKTGA